MRIGAHCSIAGGFNKSVNYLLSIGGNTMQIFSGNPRSWKKKTIDPNEAARFISLRRRHHIHPLIIHAPYLINITSPHKIIHVKSIMGLADELKRATILNADYLVLHPGNAGDLSRKEKTAKIINTLKTVLNGAISKPMILIENTAGMGRSMGSDLDELLLLRKKLNGKIGFCLDTAHGFQAGYTPQQLISHEISDFTEVIHINDSKTELGSRIDRHHHIGKGEIGFQNFRKLINYPKWKDKPFILETPWEKGQDRKNIELLKSFAD